MKRPIVGVFLGALVMFIWGAISWMVLPFHDHTIKKIPEEQLVSDTLKTVVAEPGLYVFPGHEGPDGQMDNAAWSEKYRRGPVGVLAFSPAGKVPMAASNFIFEFGANAVAAGIVMMLLMFSRDRVKNIFPRAMLTMSLGLLMGISAHALYWNWFHFPAGFVLANAFDSIVGYFLMGLVLARFVPEV